MQKIYEFPDGLLFSSYVTEYHPLEKDLLYHELSKNHFDEFHRKKSTLYLIVKTRRIRFLPGSFRIGAGFRITGIVTVGDRTELVTFNVAKFLFPRHGARSGCASWEDWAEKVMAGWGFPCTGQDTAAEAYRKNSSIDLERSTEELLWIDCKLWQGMAGGNLALRTIVSPVQLAHSFDWDLLAPLEVIYVGKSKNGVLMRARNHNKWGKITTDLGPDEVAIVYFMRIATRTVRKRRIGPYYSFEELQDSDIDPDSAVKITEAALIQHFFEEQKLNVQIVRQDFREVDSVKNKLVKRKYAAVCVELLLEGVFGKMGTCKAGYHGEHRFSRILREEAS
ncbi:hypothetical protein [Pseudoduganella aquatica]|uniref:hypothetical protein n=1 Tax=Pseudoduganella aquatica TaxID=2660641 RepID=UPI001E5F01B2|nr:hypothetical protein [Pseudoduganella aquatica]